MRCWQRGCVYFEIAECKYMSYFHMPVNIYLSLR